MEHLTDLDWITLYDYLNISSKASTVRRTNSFYESFYPLKYKRNEVRQATLRHTDRDGFLGEITRYLYKVLYTAQLFLDSELVIHKGDIKDQIKLFMLFTQMQLQNLQDSLRLEYIANLINELAKKISGKTEQLEEKSFLQIKIFSSLTRILNLFKEFYFYYVTVGDGEALTKFYNVLNKLTYNCCHKNKALISLYPETGEVLVELVKFLCDQKSDRQAVFSLQLRKFLPVICVRQKNMFLHLIDESITELLRRMGYEIPKDMVENYFRSEIEINTLIAEEQNVIQPILLRENLRGTPGWRNKAVEQLVNLTVEKTIKNPSKILLLDDFRKSKGFPLFQI